MTDTGGALDVERLGRAVRACRYRFDVNERSDELAAAIAAEYARLSAQPRDPTVWTNATNQVLPRDPEPSE